MKKLYVLALLLLTSGSIYAQDNNANTQQADKRNDSPKEFRGGVKIAPFISWLKTDVDNVQSQYIKGNGVRFGFSYGLTADRFFHPNYGVNFELRITGMGASYTYKPNSLAFESIRRDFHLQYLELPVTLKGRTNEIGYVKYFGQGGFMPAVALKRKADITYTSPANLEMPKLENEKLYSDVNLFMLYFVIGLGAEYNLGGSTSLVSSLTWYNGMTNITHRAASKNETPRLLNNNNDIDTRPSYLALNIGILF